jgi:hypothetical protein
MIAEKRSPNSSNKTKLILDSQNRYVMQY